MKLRIANRKRMHLNQNMAQLHIDAQFNHIINVCKTFCENFPLLRMLSVRFGENESFDLDFQICASYIIMRSTNAYIYGTPYNKLICML